MPIGSSKLGVLGAGLVPGGTETFNASGTFSIPPGVKKVSITGVGGTGNPGNSGTAGNSGNPGGGAGGGGGGGGVTAVPGCFCIAPTTPGGGGGSSPGGGNGGAGGTTTPPGFNANAGGAGNAGNNGNAGSAGSAGNPGNTGGASSGLGQTFNGGAGGNAGAAGNAGNQGNGGTAGNGGAGMPKSPFPNTAVAVGNGGNGGGAGVAANLIGTNPPYTCARNGETLPGQQTRFANPLGPAFYMQFEYGNPFGTSSHGGGGGAGDVNSGTNFNIPGEKAGNRMVTATGIENPNPPSVIPAPIAPGPFNHPGQPVCITTVSLGPIPANSPAPFPATQGTAFNTRGVPLRGLGGNPGGGAGGYGRLFGFRQWFSPPGIVGFPPASPPGNYTEAGLGLSVSGFSATNTRAGGGGGGGGLASDPGTKPNGGGAGGGGGRGNAGNAGGNGGAGGSGVAATPSTVNCVPVTPGCTAPITVASPGGQVVISWNPQ
jgi:hypothetical protein